ncbi:Protein phosphatase 1 regulatory subunit 3B [Halocaridina rubra]|uniref:Protein phosphatase 1 regulatory subunit 3B n=1 Tax=Halocaridina rubra TaxID=373956 RepID=A0AAN8X0Z1_HALRR
MTTLMMPSDYGAEMFLGSSPVLTSGYLATQPFIHDYPRLQPTPLQTSPLQSNPLHSIWGHHTNTTNPQSCASTINSSNFKNMLDNSSFSCASSYSNGLTSRGSFRRQGSRRSSNRKKEENSLRLQPIKSCLVARQDEVEEGAISPTRLKKKVVFADDQGHPLTHIRVLTERSDCPPRWTSDFLEQVTGGAKAEAVTDQWELAFAQPASDYLGMRHKLEKEYVSLENVVIKEAENRILGTIKVRNLSYHKEVKVRYTTDHWSTHEDILCTFVPSTATSASYDIYDTFSFTLTLPSSNLADKLEFCICYTCDVTEYWDNNNNKNYVLVSFRPKKSDGDLRKPEDVYDVTLDSWSEFASWNHLSISDSPYW